MQQVWAWWVRNTLQHHVSTERSLLCYCSQGPPGPHSVCTLSVHIGHVVISTSNARCKMQLGMTIKNTNPVWAKCLSLFIPVQNQAGGSQQGGAGAGDGVDEGAPFHSGLPCGTLPQWPALQEHHLQQERGYILVDVLLLSLIDLSRIGA